MLGGCRGEFVTTNGTTFECESEKKQPATCKASDEAEEPESAAEAEAEKKYETCQLFVDNQRNLTGTSRRASHGGQERNGL